MTEQPSDRHPLSFNQDFLTLFDQGDDDGPFGPKYNITYAVRVTGPLRTDLLQTALDDVVVRHSALRTVVVRGDDGHQLVLPPSPVSLDVRDLGTTSTGDRDLRAEELVLEVEAGEYSAVRPPLLRATLGRFAADDAVLVLVAHHTAADEWSMPLIVRDLAALYTARATGVDADLPAAPQFVEYAAWEKERAGSDLTAKALAYWQDKLSGARILPLRTDHLRSEGLPKTTAWARFTVPAGFTSAVGEAAQEMRCSPFMLLLSAYYVYLHELTGETDIVVMSFASGRSVGAYHETVGSFFNFIPLRTDLAGCGSFRDVATRVRRTCLEAYRYEVPFPQLLGVAPELMAAAASDDGAICAFQVFRAPLATEFTSGELAYQQVRGRLLEQQSGGDVPDGAMWHLDLELDGDMPGALVYNTNLFSAEGMATLIAGYVDALGRTVTAPDARLAVAPHAVGA